MHMDFFISLFCCIMQNKQNLTTRNELWFMKWNSNLLEELRKSEEVQWESLVIYENHKRSKYSMQSMKTKFENKKFSLFSLVREQNYTKEHIFLAGKSEEKQEHTWINGRLRRRRDCRKISEEEEIAGKSVKKKRLRAGRCRGGLELQWEQAREKGKKTESLCSLLVEWIFSKKKIRGKKGGKKS